MVDLSIMVEIEGDSTFVGKITGTNHMDACFSYDDAYILKHDSQPISISLPIARKAFTVFETRNFFEGLLPEGFTRRCVAERIHAAENDYLALLSVLGRECLGAIKIIDNEQSDIAADYQKLSLDEVKELAKEGATESAELVTKAHLSLTGASGKVGLYYDNAERQWYLPVGDAPSTHIVKQSHVRLKRIVTNEQLCLLTALNLGIEVPESFIVSLNGTEDDNILFATKRYDRKMMDNDEGNVKIINGLKCPYRLHQEDFSQAIGISASDKYEKKGQGYLKRMLDIIRNYSEEPIKDQMRLWNLCIFNYLVGNTDNHIKNVSLLYSEDLRHIRLAPAYDIVSTVIYQSSTEEMSLGIDDTFNIRDIDRTSFVNEAAKCGIGKKIALNVFDNMTEGFNDALKKAAEALTDQGFEDAISISNLIIEKGGISRYM